MGLFSLASSLKKEGYEIKILNLGLDPSVAEKRIKGTESEIYGIDMQWMVHADGAIKIAELCKKYHSDRLVVIGGLTATWFSLEIMRDYPFVDAIILGEAELSISKLAKNYLHNGRLAKVKGIVYRANGAVRKTPMPKPPSSLDDFSFTDISLMEDSMKYLKTTHLGYHEKMPSSFWLCIARGCPYNCIHCGGGVDSYKLVTMRETPIFRPPRRVAEDIAVLNEQGVSEIHLSHDPEIMGKRYWSKLFTEIRNNHVDVSLYWESFRLPSKAFLEDVERTFYFSRAGISPESPSEEVRNLVGRPFSNEQLIRSIELCDTLGICTDVFFIAGLPGETEAFFPTFKCIAERLSKGLWTGIVPPLLYTLDPNCLMALNPEKYGVKPLLKRFEDYKRISVSSEPIDQIGHETCLLTRNQILKMTKDTHNYLTGLPAPLMRPAFKMTVGRPFVL